MALIKTYTKNGEEFVDAYHTIRNVRVERVRIDGLIPAAEKGFYVVLDIDIYKEKYIPDPDPIQHRGFVNVMIDSIHGNLFSIINEVPNNPIFYIENLEEVPTNIIQYGYDLMKTLPMYAGAIDG